MNFTSILRRSVSLSAVSATALAALLTPLKAQLFDSLQAMPGRVKVGDPAVESASGREGPKGVATADFNADGKPDLVVSNLDGTVTYLKGDGTGDFLAPVHLQTGGRTLRGIIAADLNGDGAPDVAAAAPADSKVLLFINGGGTFGAPVVLETWFGARDLAAGDFDGDGDKDLAIAGPGRGLEIYTSQAGGDFGPGRSVPRAGSTWSWAYQLNFRPVYTMEALPVPGSAREDLLVTNSYSHETMVVSTAVAAAPAAGVFFDPANQSPPFSFLPASSPVYISEFVVDNEWGIKDEDGERPDWIELYNDSSAPVNLAGWTLSDDPANPALWTFPSVTIAPGHFLVVMASDKNRIDPGGRLHTNFKLSKSGDSILLSKPNGTLVHHVPVGSALIGGYWAYAPVPPEDYSTVLGRDGNWGVCSAPSPGWENGAPSSYYSYYYSPYHYVAPEVTAFSATPDPIVAGQNITLSVQRPGLAGHTNYSYIWRMPQGGWWSGGEYQPLNLNGDEAVITIADPKQGEVISVSIWSYWQETAPDPNNPWWWWNGWRYETVLSEMIVVPHEEVEPFMQPVASVPTDYSPYALAAGRVLQPAGAGGPPDLVTAHKYTNSVEIRRGVSGPARFESRAAAKIEVPGGPRALVLTDLNQDGLTDIVVALRYFDRVVSYKNKGSGQFELTSEVPTGVSPRDMVSADFDGNGQPDVAVVNRVSSDVTVLPTSTTEAAFGKLDQVYATDGDVSGLAVYDFNNDGRDDVIQIHRASGDLSVRLSGPQGQLAAPVFYPVGDAPSALAWTDVNNDGHADVVAAILGSCGEATGGVTVRLGDGAGGFGPLLTYALPAGASGGLFAITPADFNGDGFIDLAAGYYDCRVAFYQGSADGAMTHKRTIPFTYESRVMTTGDFDNDGDTDLAGAGYAGDVVVLENGGNLLTTTLRRYDYDPTIPGKMGANQIFAAHVDNDSDLDLLMGTGNGVVLLRGSTGVTFISPQHTISGSSGEVSGMVVADLDGDGDQDLVTACRLLSCMTVFTQNGNGEYTPALTVDVPAGAMLATGDLDGDGLADLVGSGDTLWVALSSHVPTITTRPVETLSRAKVTGFVINEILTRNNEVKVPPYDLKGDYVELFNNNPATMQTGGWKLRYESTDDAGAPVTRLFTLPAGTLKSGGHRIVLFDDAETGPLVTGFKLPSTAATITLLNPQGQEADSVSYLSQRENIAIARFQDASPTFVQTAVPTPGHSNADNGTLEPEVSMVDFKASDTQPGQPVRFTAKGRDDVGLIGVWVYWKRLDINEPNINVLYLYDDGYHGDGAVADGTYSNVLTGLPPSAEIQYYIQATDLSWRTVTLPEDPRFIAGGGTEQVATWSLAFSPQSPLRINEVVSDNRRAFRDASNDSPDYVELFNDSNTQQSLAGICVARSFHAAPEDTFAYTAGQTLPPRGLSMIHCDANPGGSGQHAPFTLDNDGDTLVLMATGPHGGRVPLESVSVPPLAEDESWFRAPGSAVWLTGPASPDAPAPAEGFTGFGRDAAGVTQFTHIFSTVPGITFIPEHSATMLPGSWSPDPAITGDGRPRSISRPAAQRGFFRIRQVPN